MLATLKPEDFALVEPLLKPVRLEQRQVLVRQGDKITQIYFPTNAVVALAVGLTTGQIIESAAVGRNGVVGARAALDGNDSLSWAMVKLTGDAMCCEASALKSVVLQSPALMVKLFRHEQMLLAEAQQSTACMAMHTAEARICRCLLICRDLSGSNTLHLTQELLGEMLGIQRTSVTIVAGVLQQAGLIQYARGKIEILDAERLEEAACECYHAIKMHHAAL